MAISGNIEVAVEYIASWPRTIDPDFNAQFPGWFVMLRDFDKEELRMSVRYDTEEEAEEAAIPLFNAYLEEIEATKH